MSTEQETPNLEKLLSNPTTATENRQVLSSSDQVASLQGKVDELEDKIKEERFLWILLITVVVDMIVFGGIENWAGALVIGVLQLIGLVVLAQKCRVDPIIPLIDRIGGFFGSRKPDKL